MLARPAYDLDHGVDDTMCRLAVTQLDCAKTQGVMDSQRRCPVQVIVQQAVRPFQPAQRLQRKTLSPCTVLGFKTIQRACGQAFRQQSPFSQNLIQQIDRAAPRRCCAVRHGFAFPVTQARIAKGGRGRISSPCTERNPMS